MRVCACCWGRTDGLTHPVYREARQEMSVKATLEVDSKMGKELKRVTAFAHGSRSPTLPRSLPPSFVVLGRFLATVLQVRREITVLPEVPSGRQCPMPSGPR